MGGDAAGATVRRDAGIVLAVVGVLAVPHLLLGPSITADDWVWIRNGEFLGWWDAGGTRQVGRPGAYALYALVFGLGGAHPLVHYLVQVALWAGASALVLLALREVLEHRLALVVTLVWLLAPSHTTLEMWASTSQAWVAIALLAVGARQVARCARGEAALWPGLLALGAAGAFYEVALVAAPVVAQLVDRRINGSWHWRTGMLAGAAALPVLIWSMAFASVYSSEVATTEEYWIEHLAGSLGMGLPIESRGAAALVVVVAVVAGALVLLRARRSGAGRLDMALVFTGGALAVAGTVPALRSYTIPFGMGDRLTAVSGIGAALLWAGALRSVLAAVPQRTRLALAGGALVLAMVARWDNLDQWNDVGDEAAEAAAELGAEALATSDGLLIVEGEIASRREFYGIYDGWNATAAAQVVAGESSLVLQVDIRCIRSGPLADDPLEQYGQRAEQRVPGCRR